MLILFLHGWQSVPGGVKPTYLIEHGHEVLNPALPDDDFDQAIAIAQAEFDMHQPDVIVGSSRGGAVAMNIDAGDTPLVLLCPAWKRWGTARTVKANTIILHSRADDVIPFADSEELVRDSGLPAYTLMEVGHDHRLADPESLEMMLAACGEDDEDEADSVLGDEEDPLEADWTGLCYTAVLRWARDVVEDDWVVVHGTVFSPDLRRRIQHAWCERGEFVADLTLPIGKRIIHKEAYCRTLQPQVEKVYSIDDARLLAIRNRHEGPWTEEEQLKR